MREPIRPGLLIPDDFAMRRPTAPQADDRYGLVSERPGRLPVITGDRAPRDCPPRVPQRSPTPSPPSPCWTD